MTVFQEIGRTFLVTFLPIIAGILAFGAFRAWRVFGKK